MMKNFYTLEKLKMPVRIAILGGPRCGKTTLIQQLYVDMKIRDINVGVATEYSTDYLRDKGMIESISEQYGIYLGQLHLEKALDGHEYASYGLRNICSIYLWTLNAWR